MYTNVLLPLYEFLWAVASFVQRCLRGYRFDSLPTTRTRVQVDVFETIIQENIGKNWHELHVAYTRHQLVAPNIELYCIIALIVAAQV